MSLRNTQQYEALILKGMKLVDRMKEYKDAKGWFVDSSLRRSEMFIDRDTMKPLRRSKGRNDNRLVPGRLSSAPPNGTGGWGVRHYKHRTPTG